MNKERAFAFARDLISSLPIRERALDFWDMPRVQERQDRALWIEAADRLEEVAARVHEDMAIYFRGWASDAAVGAGEFERGLDLAPAPKLGGRESLRASNVLDLKLLVGRSIAAREVTALFGPKVTSFGRENLDRIEAYIQVQLDERSARDHPLSIASWTADAHQHAAGYSLFNGHPSYLVCRPPAGWHFSYSKRAEQDCVALIRDAENAWREECDLPRIGEGWVSETKLYYDVKASLPDLEIVQHYRADWLGRQHLDIAIPALRVAIEFQGAQHDQPVAFFGGEEAFARTQARDRQKVGKCQRKGWRLLLVRDGYVLSDLLADIQAEAADRR